MARLSPDGTRAATVEQNGIAVIDLTRGTRLRLPSEGVPKRGPVWRRDGQTITYQSQNDIFQQAIDGPPSRLRCTPPCVTSRLA